jgi:hypothetical protein
MNSRRFESELREREKRIRKMERSERFDGMDGDCIEKRNRD